MSTIPHQAVSAEQSSGAWHDVIDVVRALGSTLDPVQTVASVRALLTDRAGSAVEVFLVDGEKRRLVDPIRHRETPYPDRLAAVLQVTRTQFALGGELDPNHTGSVALGLRDGDTVAALAIFRGSAPDPDPAWSAIAALCGSAITRALRFESLAKLTGASENTRSMQQQILDHVSHEFNTPLMILRSSAEFARTASDEERELFFDMHEQALDRLEQLVHGVIEVAHASARGETESLGTEDIVSALVLPHFIDDEWPASVPDLWHRSTPAQVEVEQKSIGLAIEHLLTNARVHAAPSGARVAVAIYGTERELRPRPLEEALQGLNTGNPSLPPESDHPDCLVIEVIDSGPGIPAAELGLIFEPFTQASNSPLRGVSGAGMGLATASRLAEAAGGTLEVESLLGAGSLFRLRLPAH